MADSVVQQQHGDGRHDQRQRDPEDDDQVVRSVQIRRFGQTVRHRRDSRPADNAVVHADGARQNQSPERIVQSQIPDVQENRDHAAVEEHGEHDQELNHGLEHHVLRREEIPREQRQDDVDRQRDNHDDQDVFVAAQQQRMRQRQLIGAGGHHMRQEQHALMHGQVRRGREGRDQAVPDGVQRQQAQEDQQEPVDDRERSAPRRLFDVILVCLHHAHPLRTDWIPWFCG